MKHIRTIPGARRPIFSWCDVIEEGAMEQAANLAKLPFAFKHVSLMPDCHQGYGMPIGGVLATEGVMVPNAVGVDIGCGMRAVKFNVMADSLSKETLLKIVGEIRDRVPVGQRHNKKPCADDEIPEWKFDFIPSVVSEQFESARYQIKSAGSGNHFLELQRDEEGYLWAMVHSGSRNLGKRVADRYNKVAKGLNAKWHSSVPKEHDLAFLPLDTEEGNRYMKEMDYCVRFAEANRKAIMKEIKCAVIGNITGLEHVTEEIDVAHNYARFENHFGRNVVVHRKGATSARAGEIGIIPGSQGSASYIVEGLGEHDSFCSCSHGAGRRMGRKQAQRELSLETEVKRMEDMGVIHGIRSTADLDEAAGAYKDIDAVMASQTDLVKVVRKLIPLAVVKG